MSQTSITLDELLTKFSNLEKKVNEITNGLVNFESGSSSTGYWIRDKGTGLTIQWGKDTRNNNYQLITLPTPFKTTNYVVQLTPCGNYETGIGTFDYTTTSFKKRTGGGVPSTWLAVGF